MAAAKQTLCVPLQNSDDGQTIFIPKNFALAGNEAQVTREKDGTLSVATLRRRSAKDLYELISQWEPLRQEDTMPAIPDLPLEPVDL